MRSLVARYPLWFGLCLSPGLALAQTKPGSLPAASAGSAAKPAAKPEKKAKALEKPATKPAEPTAKPTEPKTAPGVELGFDFPPPSTQGPEVDASGLPSGVTSGGDAGATSSGDASWLRSLTPPDLPTRYDERVVRYLHFYRDTPSGRAIARSWAKK